MVQVTWTPAMAAQLTDHAWTMREWLAKPVCQLELDHKVIMEHLPKIILT